MVEAVDTANPVDADDAANALDADDAAIALDSADAAGSISVATAISVGERTTVASDTHAENSTDGQTTTDAPITTEAAPESDTDAGPQADAAPEAATAPAPEAELELEAAASAEVVQVAVVEQLVQVTVVQRPGPAAVVERPVPMAPVDEGAELAARARRRARRRFWAVAVLLVAVVGGVATYNVRSAATLQAAVVAVPSATVLTPGTPPVLPWPTVGQSAVLVPAVGFSSQSGAEQPVPIASLTKLMTAWLILHDHPLAVGEDGPSVTMTSVDVEDVDEDDETDQANVPVAAGEILTERQLLEGLIVHSANNLADTLARWDAGTIPAFVAKMNAAAASLGMTNTHYVDADGFDSQSVWTAADVLKVAAQLMANPTFAGIAQLQSVTLPVAGTEDSYTPLLGTHDVVGVKSGFTSEAGGCDVLALSQTVDGRKVLVLAAVTGQLGASPLAQAGLAALSVANAAIAGVHNVEALTRGQVLANVILRGASVPAVAARDASVLAWAGTPVRVSLDRTRHVEGGARRGTTVGVAVVESAAERSVAPARLSGQLPTASLVERLF